MCSNCKVWTLRQTYTELDLSALSAFCFRKSATHEKRVCLCLSGLISR